MAFDYRKLGFFDMVYPHDRLKNHLKRLPKNIKVTNYTVETGDCLCIPPWIMHATHGFNNSIGVTKFYERAMPFILDYKVRCWFNILDFFEKIYSEFTFNQTYVIIRIS